MTPRSLERGYPLNLGLSPHRGYLCEIWGFHSSLSSQNFSSHMCPLFSYYTLLGLPNGCLFNTLTFAALGGIQLSSMHNTCTYCCILLHSTNFCHSMYTFSSCLILWVYPYMWNTYDCCSPQLHRQNQTLPYISPAARAYWHHKTLDLCHPWSYISHYDILQKGFWITSKYIKISII